MVENKMGGEQTEQQPVIEQPPDEDLAPEPWSVQEPQQPQQTSQPIYPQYSQEFQYPYDQYQQPQQEFTQQQLPQLQPRSEEQWEPQYMSQESVPDELEPEPEQVDGSMDPQDLQAADLGEEPESVLKMEPEDIKNLVLQGSEAYSDGRYTDAILAWQQVLEEEPDAHPDIKIAIEDAMDKLKEM